MKKSVKLVTGIIAVLFLAYLGYSVYNETNETMGSFDKFDINSTASKYIKVEVVHDKGFTPGPDGGVVFYVKDINGTVKKVSYGNELPHGIEKSKIVNLNGHLHGDFFHATEVEFD